MILHNTASILLQESQALLTLSFDVCLYKIFWILELCSNAQKEQARDKLLVFFMLDVGVAYKNYRLTLLID